MFFQCHGYGPRSVIWGKKCLGIVWRNSQTFLSADSLVLSADRKKLFPNTFSQVFPVRGRFGSVDRTRSRKTRHRRGRTESRIGIRHDANGHERRCLSSYVHLRPADGVRRYCFYRRPPCATVRGINDLWEWDRGEFHDASKQDPGDPRHRYRGVHGRSVRVRLRSGFAGSRLEDGHPTGRNRVV